MNSVQRYWYTNLTDDEYWNWVLSRLPKCYPELGDQSCYKLYPPQRVYIYVSVVNIFAFCTGILNLMVIIAVSHFRQLHSSVNFILLSLAVSDFLVCWVGIPVYCSFQYACWPAGDIICVIYHVFLYTVTNVSVGDMILISIDRYVAICDPMHYSTRMSRRSVSIALITTWIFSVLGGMGYYRYNIIYPWWSKSCEGQCIPWYTLTAAFVDAALNVCAPIVIIVILYLRVFFVAVSQARAMRSHVAATTQRPAVKSRKSELKAARNLGFVVLLFLLCYLSSCVAFLHQSLSSIKMNYLSYLFMRTLMYLNSCFNPILYALQYPWFRRSVMQIVTFRIFQSGSRDANVLCVNR